jgi:outer membrane protein TolC
MNISRFFIQRPIFAAMLSALILLAALIALPSLPISEYPQVVPPTIVVRATYPGANPNVIADTVASPLEQAINGVEDMLYQYSQATSDGVMTLTVTFKLGTDVDKAQVQVQNRVSQALPKLPQEVQRLGVVTNKSSPDITLAVFVYSPNGRYDQTYLANFVALRIKDELARLDGVGVATADLFPRVSFSGFVGFLSGDTSQLGKAASRAWLVNPVVSWPALDFASVHARLRAASAEADGALAAYRKTVLTALEDFEDACVGYSTEETRLASVLEQAQASRRAAQLAEIQYREGSINFLVLLDAQRTLLQAEDTLAQAQTAANTGAVAVYKSLGGAGGPS